MSRILEFACNRIRTSFRTLGNVRLFLSCGSTARQTKTLGRMQLRDRQLVPVPPAAGGWLLEKFPKMDPTSFTRPMKLTMTPTLSASGFTVFPRKQGWHDLTGTHSGRVVEKVAGAKVSAAL